MPPGNVVSAQAALEQGSAAALPPVLRGLPGLPAGPRSVSLRRGFAEWTRQVVERSRAAAEDPALVGALTALEDTGGSREMGSLPAERIDERIEEKAEERAGAMAEAMVEEGRQPEHRRGPQSADGEAAP